jgi:hypothetical protein
MDSSRKRRSLALQKIIDARSAKRRQSSGGKELRSSLVIQLTLASGRACFQCLNTRVGRASSYTEMVGITDDLDLLFGQFFGSPDTDVEQATIVTVRAVYEDTFWSLEPSILLDCFATYLVSLACSKVVPSVPIIADPS